MASRRFNLISDYYNEEEHLYKKKNFLYKISVKKVFDKSFHMNHYLILFIPVVIYLLNIIIFIQQI